MLETDSPLKISNIECSTFQPVNFIGAYTMSVPNDKCDLPASKLGITPGK